MLRAIFEGRDPWQPEPRLTELLIRQLTLSGGRESLDDCVERLLDFERRGVNEIALALHGDPSKAIRLLGERDRKSTRLNSSHLVISYAVFCLKKKKTSYSPLFCLSIPGPTT